MTMLGPDATDFLVALAANNRRAWFDANKATYEATLKGPGAEFAAAVAADLTARSGLAYRSKIFRIHRDLRFAKDKTPFNAHLHIAFTPAVDLRWSHPFGQPGGLVKVYSAC